MMAAKKKAPVKAKTKPAQPKVMIDHRRYEPVKVVRADGQAHYSRDNGDALAVAMRGMTIKELQQVAKDNDLKSMDLTDYVGHAQFRMALGLRLRGVIRRGEKDIADGRRVAADYWPRINGRVIRTLAVAKKVAPAKPVKKAAAVAKKPAKKAAPVKKAAATVKKPAKRSAPVTPAPTVVVGPVAQVAA
jgi:hypothetical protein